MIPASGTISEVSELSQSSDRELADIASIARTFPPLQPRKLQRLNLSADDERITPPRRGVCRILSIAFFERSGYRFALKKTVRIKGRSAQVRLAGKTR